MLYFARWKAAAILLTALIVCAFAIPNFVGANTVKKWPEWAQRYVVLGLDLQGGSHILLEVDAADVRKQQLDTLRNEVRKTLLEARIGWANPPAIRGNAVEVRIRPGQNFQGALEKLRALSQPITNNIIGVTGQQSIDVTDAGGGLIRLAPTEAAMNERVRQTVDQSIPIIERRINGLGLVEPTVQREGIDRVLVEVPGLGDPQRLISVIGTTAKLEFRLVNQNASPLNVPPDSEVLCEVENQKSDTNKPTPPACTGATPIVVYKQVLVEGADLTNATTGFDQNNQPVVDFTFNSTGARKFGEVTQENVGRPFAIILDNQVISAPNIREPILGGRGQISGHFTVESAGNLAILLRAGALPAKLTPIEQRVVGPGLGQDSIVKGEYASVVGAALVVLFMLVTYGLFGLFANVAVAINVGMIFGILSLLNATLTLPGIAGIVLTVGIAVDSNVLIYERIREEVRHGRNAIAAIDAGFKRALATILDSNITTFIAAAVLFFIGTGPVKGFAITLGIGIVTTLFTAFTLTRLIVAYWVRLIRPRYVPI
ncbi:MAG TPA: protein translocase subunit SecD [Xanthobacteraceae bacterium]|nr:protein translocase subunit SecD [Xanthobacteraceae bacterium]